MLVSFLFSLITAVFAPECLDYLDSPIIPVVLESNNTCTGSYCYRIEYGIVNSAFEPNQIAVLMGCFEYPLYSLNMGCRRNYQGWVLCVCETDRCNADSSINVIDLPIVTCRYEFLGSDGNPDNGERCKSNYCITWRNGRSPEAGGVSSSQDYRCQEGGATPLERFDIFANTMGGTFPVGICVSFQVLDSYINEMCACPYNTTNCTTPTLYPKESDRPLDTRTTGLIDCASPSEMGGMRKCKGHVCYIMKQRYRDNEYGCIRYDERFMDKKFKLGTQKILDYAYFFCDKSMCNANEDPERVFEGLHLYEDTNQNYSCDCTVPLGNLQLQPDELKETAFNLTLLLSISIPITFVFFLMAVVIAYRIYTKQWPNPFSCLCEKSRQKGRIGHKPTLITVISPVSKRK